MFPEKPKRNQKTRFLVLVLLVPLMLLFHNVDFGFSGDVFAMTVMICSAIYLTYQFVEWLIGKTWS